MLILKLTVTNSQAMGWVLNTVQMLDDRCYTNDDDML